MVSVSCTKLKAVKRHGALGSSNEVCERFNPGVYTSTYIDGASMNAILWNSKGVLIFEQHLYNAVRSDYGCTSSMHQMSSVQTLK